MLRDLDSADRLFLFRALATAMPAGLIMGAAAGYYLRKTGDWSGWIVLGGALAGLAIGGAAGWFAYWSAGKTSRGLVHVLTAAGNLPAAPSFSYQESLVARGRYQEAADAFAAHLVDHPLDHDARLAHASILADHLGHPDAAAKLYLAVRQTSGDAGLEYRASQSLIDLYAAAGDRGRHLAELARFAERFRGTAAGRAAKEAVAKLKLPPGP